MVVYLLIVAILNLGLGFAASAHLGRRYRAMVDSSAWAEFDMALDTLSSTFDALRQPEAPIPPAGGAAPSGSCKPAIEDLQKQVDHFDVQLADAYDELRKCAESSDPAAIQPCFNALLAATEEYLERRSSEYQQLEELARHDAQWAAALNGLRAAVQLQNTEIEMLNQAMVAVSAEAAKDGCQRVVARTHRMASANHHLRDVLGQCMAMVNAADGEAASGGQIPSSDPLTGLADRTVLEAELHMRWDDDARHARCLALAMVDLDHFGRLNEKFGYRVGNEVLRAVGQLLQSQCKGEARLSRFTGQRFAMVFPNSDLRSATNVAEQVRQTIEAARFYHAETEIRVTASCSVTEATPEDTTTAMFARAEAAMREAKHYGRNRTFVYEGEYPTPVVPPSLTVEEKQLTL